MGDTTAQILPRSTYKPLQALGCLMTGIPLTSRQVATAAASHGGAQIHIEAVESILQDYSISESALQCPVDYPEDEKSRVRLIREGKDRSPIFMNCSGKHAAMLAACAYSGWSTSDYLDPSHPLQKQIREATVKLSGTEVSTVAVDGCGAPLFSTTTRGVATTFRNLALAEPDSLENRVAAAIRAYPDHIAGECQPNTLSMQAFPGSIAKGGAEGVIGMATAEGASVGIKVIDGSLRATTVIAVAALERIGALPEGSLDSNPQLAVTVYGGGLPVGDLRPAQELIS